MNPSTSRPWLNSYAPNVPTHIDLPEGSLVDIVDESAERFPSDVALEFFGSTTTYSSLRDQIARAAEGLRAAGVRAGDPVAIVLPNCPQHVVAFYAVLRLGAVVVEHNPLYTPRELRHQFEDHGARVVIAWDRVCDTIRDFPDDVRVDTIISVNITRAMPLSTRVALRLPIRKARESRAALTGPAKGTVDWRGIVGSGRLDPEHPRPGGTDLAVIQYTSGTTGSPKGAELSHLNLSANAAQARAWVPTIERGTSVVYAVLPMFHAYGLTLCLTFAMSMGSRLVLFPKFDVDLVLKVIPQHPPTFLPAVPPIYAKLQEAATARNVSLAGIDIAISGAMTLPESVVIPWEEKSGGYLVEGYGLSECSPVLMANPVGPTRRAGTVGLPLPSTEVRVVDPENPTEDRAPGEEGELIVRGPQVFSRYHGKPEETAAVFVDGDWFRTGDIVTLDDDGFVRVVDRIKELIITGGFNVSPSEVEEALRGYDGVEDAAVVGIPRNGGDEDVVAAVVLSPGAEGNAEALRAHVRAHLTPYKVPRRVVFVDELPRSLIGKVLRRQVRDGILADDATST
ncbi:long-chain-fatty-acid--CoA ligase [Planctomonas psychrotolerans]|uniref:long-chain-fatty-acid--CoA ligase n=1 Tax=Planctomonas psychrotolerans TaxID=2528712 RepID=UPI00123AB476|nr:long-chain-fatty-acid--CoA ligase [Planctomonas psychrotolerans]